MNFFDYKVTSPYGNRTFKGQEEFHNGIDYALPLNTEVTSNISGTVETADFQKNGYGNYVVIKDGTGKLHYYAHLLRDTVDVGDTISVGDTIGYSGSTGRSTGPHLHYEVREGNISVNPSPYLTLQEDATQTIETTNTTTTTTTTTNNSWFDNLNPFDNIKDKLKSVVFNIFKFIIIALLIILFVVFITKSLDISII